MRIMMLAFSNFHYVVELTEALSELEDVVLMIPDKLNRLFEDEMSSVVKKKFDICEFHYPRMRYPTNVLMIYRIIRKINQISPDVIHLQKGHPWFNLAIPLLKRQCLVTTIHDVIPLDWPSQRIPSFTYKPPIKYATQLIVHGQRLKETMVKEFNRSADDIHVLPRGVNSICARYAKESIDEEGHTVLFFGRLWEHKGLRYLIEAEPLISKKIPDLKIIVAGEGENFQKYREMMVNKERFVVLNEYIPDDKVNVLFQKASLVVLPYVDGSQSAVIPQAYVFKKPVVVTDVGSFCENVDQGVTGYIVPPRDPKSLAEAIIDLLMDDEKRKRMGENAYRKIKEELSWKNIAPRTIEVYKKALSVKSKSIQKS